MTTLVKLATIYSIYTVMCVTSSPVLPPNSSEEFLEGPINATNATEPKDLYVIKTYVYEVGILTDAGNGTDNSTETNEEIDLTFFNPVHNGSKIDLSNIPVPIQTNVSGVSLTALAPINFGTLDLEGGKPVLNGTILPNVEVSVKENVTTANNDKSKKILDELSPILGLEKAVQNQTTKNT